jgi:NADH-quinone oxidoreductase subunit E
MMTENQSDSKREVPSLINTTSIKIEILTRDLASNIDAIIEKHHDPTKLVGILLEIQDIIPEQYLPMEVAAYVSQKMDLPLSQVYDVISFYEALSSVPRARYMIQVCDSVVCKVTGNTALKAALEEVLGLRIGEVSPDRKFALENSPCFGACDISPAIRVNGVVYGHLTSTDQVRQALSGCL